MFTGSGVALVTPFKDGEVHYEKLKELLEWHVANQTDAIIICGTTGEASTLTDKERKAVIKFTVDVVNGRIPVIAGSGSNNTAHAVELSQYCESVGVDGLLVVTPYYNKATDLGLLKHYEMIANSVQLPIILYNVPGRTGVNLTPPLVQKLAQIKNIVGIKEASGDISQVAEMIRLCGEDFLVYSGNDDMIVPVLSLGGQGVISVLANILPQVTHDLVSSYLEGDVKKSRQLQLGVNGLVHALFIEVNPIPIKTAMNVLGMEVGSFRLPLTEMAATNLVVLKKELTNYGL
ncbi:4-hydroxy-tetrahydrodipicolinate synthase [Turicibacter sp. TJ11]|uniref:4-hydroxy-tetrahydrodipicolinate synthase n=1 Tax=Turicibacter sp. TJ11 TaxID=2806443 RepID=UPI001F451577|nr:4-hydroxy-tetrahydrodipicolinate synthase [Turicibacter sp. TJ11]